LLQAQQASGLLVVLGRPKGSVNKKVTPATPEATNRTLSAEGKARIAAAQKKRWASLKRAAKRATAVTVATKQIPGFEYSVT
jgi:hypothetical protein